ncbi:MAG: alpha/beta hydrolase [Ignavibacteria bacterium]|nr:alpha/beta hydrolase [Ignavibacteria bacterium]MBK7445182.1 alpha/beta hydrolase [Ignavibacteria bacterium]MBK8383276.1 alpha/beta hydrolase [Ignavibacteria bacterium]MBK9403098.1 alpha/beta hydrolase [Ignavibacteria bacterium]
MIKNKINKVSLKIKNKTGDDLITDFRFPESGTEKLPLVILCHGFKGFKDWGCFPYMMERIAEEGNFAVSFNFSYNGTGENDFDQSDFTRLDLFAENTFSRELDDLGSIIDHLFENKDKYNYDKGNITLTGHSRGGGIAILKTAEDKRISKLVVLSSVCNFDRYSDTLKKKWKEVGYFEVINSRTNQMMRLNYTLIEDLIKNKERLDIQKAISEITVPVMIIHGAQDITVDYSNAEDLYSRSDKEKTKLFLIENTGHTFGAVQPFEGTTKALEEVLTLIEDFLSK